ncbi:hypothetical protein RRG08_060852 [Elysia crispata]|uniref:Uncharacterized protein n=1 Tax=Elysia crispata TaxID=231223 RepID=A0AAE0ZG05_9GAST|nr:hypothetical protein RRG08_060852 [Elysia crispata]
MCIPLAVEKSGSPPPPPYTSPLPTQIIPRPNQPLIDLQAVFPLVKLFPSSCIHYQASGPSTPTGLMVGTRPENTPGLILTRSPACLLQLTTTFRFGLLEWFGEI